MCRIVSYIGPPVALSRVLTRAPHSLQHQSRNARQMHGSAVAGDGWGIGWFAPIERDPGMVKSILPLWADENARTMSGAICSQVIVGHARYASPGGEVCFLNTPLYALDHHLWTMNGEVSPWPGSIAAALRDAVDPDYAAEIKGATDAEVLAALWRTQLRRVGAANSARATTRMAEVTRELAEAFRSRVSMNVIIASAEQIVALRFAYQSEPNSLYSLEGSARWRDASLVASEPLDDSDEWREVPVGSFVTATTRGVKIGHLLSDT